MADRDFDSNDPLIARVRDTLAPMPRVDASDVARMLVAVHGRRRTMRERILERIWFMRIPSVSTLGVASVAVLALTVGFMSRDMLNRDTEPALSTSTASASTNATTAIDSAARAVPVAVGAVEELEVPIQFVINVPNATSVALVGDFNGWDASAIALERVPGSPLWTTTYNLKPGRHVYAFVVDGTKWIRDPRAAEAVDEDFGRPQSVIVVQMPWSGSR
jgi:hypothetical protein